MSSDIRYAVITLFILHRGGDNCQRVGELMLDLACRTVCGTVCVPLSRGVWGHAPPGKFCISGPLRLALMQSGSIS